MSEGTRWRSTWCSSESESSWCWDGTQLQGSRDVGLDAFFQAAQGIRENVGRLRVPETSEFTKPPGSYEFCGFSFRKNQERASKFGSILGRDRGLVNNCPAAVGRAPNWTGGTLNSSDVGRISQLKISPHYFLKYVISNSTGNVFGINIDLLSGFRVFAERKCLVVVQSYTLHTYFLEHVLSCVF